MRVSSVSAADDRPSAVGLGVGGGGYRDAESLFRTKPISEIRNVESATRKNIENKKEELRQLVGTRYRDLIDSADSISLMKSSCESISANISSIQSYIRSLSSSTAAETPKLASPNPARVGVYGIACRVKYLVDTPENIWGCLDESMFLEAAGRYVRAKHAQQRLIKLESSGSRGGGAAEVDQTKILANFPLLQHQWQIVESFKAQISQRSRERLLDPGLGIGAYVDALAAVSVVDELEPKQVLELFLDSRKTWILQKLNACTGDPSYSDVVSVSCDVLSVIQVTVGQVGELFLQVLSDMPLFYKIILSTPPASQLFGGIPNPEEEVGLWKSFRDKLESVMVILDKKYIAKTCLSWLRDCGGEIVSKVSGRHLIEAIGTGLELGSAEKLIRETIDSKEVLKDGLDWLKSVFGSEIELPWSRTRELVLEDDLDLWDEIFEKAFVQRMKSIIDSRFENLAKSVSIAGSVHAVGEITGEKIDFQAYLNRPSMGGGVWFIESSTKKVGSILGNKSPPQDSDFQSCLTAYFGLEVNQIRDAVDRRCQSVLEDLLSFFESPKAAQRLKNLALYVQNKCYDSVSTILEDINKELETLYIAMKNKKDSDAIPPAVIIERALFLGRLLFALQSHSRHIPLILGSPRLWTKETMAAVSDKLASLLRQPRVALESVVTADSSGRQLQTGLRKQTSFATAALLGAEEKTNPKLEELNRTMRDLCTKAHTLWIQWLSDELSVFLSCDLVRDDGLSATTPLRGWEETIIKQEQDESQSELKISLPSMPSLYIISFLCRASEEIHRIGGHVLDKSILQKFASSLLEKITIIYGDFLSAREASGPQISEKGVLQMLLDLRFVSDILSGSDTSTSEESSRSTMTRSSFRRKQDQHKKKSVIRGHADGLISRLAQKLDPIDWLTYEPYLWENEKQSYLRHAVLFGFFVQLNRMYTDTVQKLPTNSESNIMRCSTVPRFKYLPISAPALSSRSTNKVSTPAGSDEALSRSPWKAYANGELSRKSDLEDSLSFSMASPFRNLKSFMQAGSKFGESTLKLGSMLTDGQVGIFKDRSAAAMSTFGDILPAQAAGLLSSFTAARSEQ